VSKKEHREHRHRPHHHRRHRRELFVFFLHVQGGIGELVMQILSNDTKGLNLVLAETAAGVAVPLSKGPFTLAVTDPGVDPNGQNGIITVTPGSADQTTPTNFKPSGNGKTGTITVVVTDTSTTPPLVSAPATFDVVAPAPPVPDALVASFAPAP
jgi:hypothetical protein